MFEWDSIKAESNEAKHSVSFPFATRAFDDEDRLTVTDDRFEYGEARLHYPCSNRATYLRLGLHHERFGDSSHFSEKG